jgi:hypothetical protein
VERGSRGSTTSTFTSRSAGSWTLSNRSAPEMKERDLIDEQRIHGVWVLLDLG